MLKNNLNHILKSYLISFGLSFFMPKNIFVFYSSLIKRLSYPHQLANFIWFKGQNCKFGITIQSGFDSIAAVKTLLLPSYPFSLFCYRGFILGLPNQLAGHETSMIYSFVNFNESCTVVLQYLY
jgi:hypothetical protein